MLALLNVYLNWANEKEVDKKKKTMRKRDSTVITLKQIGINTISFLGLGYVDAMAGKRRQRR